MAHEPRHSPEHMVLSGIIPHVLEQIVEYSAETAEELCRLALVCRHWSVASESNTIWKPLCLKLQRDFDTLPHNQQALARATPRGTQWKDQYVGFEMVKAKMRKNVGVWKKPVEFRLLFGDDRVYMIRTAEMYLFVVTFDDKETVLVYSRDTGQLVNTLEAQHTGEIISMWPDQTGKTLVMVTDNGGHRPTVRIWDAASGACRLTMQPQLHYPCGSATVFYTWRHNNRVLLVENSLNTNGPMPSLDLMLSSYDVETGQLMQTSAIMEDIGCLIPRSPVRVASGCYALIVTRAVGGTDTEYLSVWDLQFLSCVVVIETVSRGAICRHLLLDPGSTSIVSHTYCDEVPAKAEDRDSVTVWDFTGAIKLQLQTTHGDRFNDAVVSQHKLILLQAHSITVWCLATGRMQHRTDLGPGQCCNAAMLGKYLYDSSVIYTRGMFRSRLVQACVDRMLASLLNTKRDVLGWIASFNNIDVIVKEQDSPIMRCHTLDFSLPHP